MKNLIWIIRVRLGDWWRVLYRRIRPAQKHYTLEIHDSSLKIGDD